MRHASTVQQLLRSVPANLIIDWCANIRYWSLSARTTGGQELLRTYGDQLAVSYSSEIAWRTR